MDPYQILGLQKTATDDEIKKAYKKLAMKYHPDRDGGNEDKFKEVKEAYELLSDSERRAKYDQFGHAGPNQHFHNQHHFNQEDLQDLFRNFGGDFSEMFSFAKRNQQPRRNKDLKIQITVPLESTLTDQRKLVNIQTTNGHKETIDITIPRGIQNNSSVKYTGLGDNFFNTLPRGDLYVHVNVVNHTNFQIYNSVDLLTTLTISCLDAIVGCDRIVRGIDGKEFEIKIPAGIQPHSKLRIADNGLFVTNSQQRGSLYVEILVSIPKNLKPEHIDLIQQIQANL